MTSPSPLALLCVSLGVVLLLSLPSLSCAQSRIPPLSSFPSQYVVTSEYNYGWYQESLSFLEYWDGSLSLLRTEGRFSNEDTIDVINLNASVSWPLAPGSTSSAYTLNRQLAGNSPACNNYTLATAQLQSLLWGPSSRIWLTLNYSGLLWTQTSPATLLTDRNIWVEHWQTSLTTSTQYSASLAPQVLYLCNNQGSCYNSSLPSAPLPVPLFPFNELVDIATNNFHSGNVPSLYTDAMTVHLYIALNSTLQGHRLPVRLEVFTNRSLGGAASASYTWAHSSLEWTNWQPLTSSPAIFYTFPTSARPTSSCVLNTSPYFPNLPLSPSLSGVSAIATGTPLPVSAITYDTTSTNSIPLMGITVLEARFTDQLVSGPAENQAATFDYGYSTYPLTSTSQGVDVVVQYSSTSGVVQTSYVYPPLSWTLPYYGSTGVAYRLSPPGNVSSCVYAPLSPSTRNPLLSMHESAFELLFVNSALTEAEFAFVYTQEVRAVIANVYAAQFSVLSPDQRYLYNYTMLLYLRPYSWTMTGRGADNGGYNFGNNFNLPMFLTMNGTRTDRITTPYTVLPYQDNISILSFIASSADSALSSATAAQENSYWTSLSNVTCAPAPMAQGSSSSTGASFSSAGPSSPSSSATSSFSLSSSRGASALSSVGPATVSFFSSLASPSSPSSSARPLPSSSSLSASGSPTSSSGLPAGPPGESSSSSLSGGGIAGIVVGSVVGALMLVCLLILCVARRNRKEKAAGGQAVGTRVPRHDHSRVSADESEEQGGIEMN